MWLALGAAVVTVASAPAVTNVSSWVFYGPGGRLLQQPDELGNRILDHSGVGYRGGVTPIPDVPVKATVSPLAGDDGANIQAAINQVQALPLDTNGFRGALLLTAGEYQISNSITINAGGVVLRGVGDATNGTVLRGTGTNQRTLVVVTGSGSAAISTTRNVTNHYVPVGARSFDVDSAAGFAVGDRVFVHRPSPANWIHDLGMDLLTYPWAAGSKDLRSDRVITRIEGNYITLDVPLTCALEQIYGGATLEKFNWPGRIQNVGIEDLRGDSDYTSVTDEAHAWTFIQFNNVEHGWVRRVTAQHFGFACVDLNSGTKSVTVADCRSLTPISQITGSRRYAFEMQWCCLCLVQNCYTSEDRHQFATSSITTGPNVFVDGWSDGAYDDAGPHHRWATGGLWDNVTVNGHQLNVQNRGNSGTGHGWAGANVVVWNCAAAGFIVQNPPTARNWLIGSVGPVLNGTMYVGPHDPGTYESSGSNGANVYPSSLYYAQLQDRLAAPRLETREYWLGQINRFTNSAAPGEPVPVDAAWRVAVSNAAPGAALNGFDVTAANQWVRFTFNFSLAATDRVVAATLSLSLKAASAAAADDVLYLDRLTNAFSLAGLGWTPISTVTNNPTVRVLDLSGQLGWLADGQLNVALQNDVGVDWAMLELQVAPALNGVTSVLYPEADATVRGGASANSNFGTATTLMTKEDPSEDYKRKAWLRWNLASVPSAVQQAWLRLTPIAVSTNGVEQGVAFTTNDAWSEMAVTWNKQPAATKRFATWIPAVNIPVEVAVTPQVQEAMAGDRQLSLLLHSIRDFGPAGVVQYGSREYGAAEFRPQLRLLLAGPPSVPRITFADVVGGNFALGGTNGPPNGVYHVLTSTDASLPLASWASVATNTFDAVGSFSFTNPAPAAAWQFFVTRVP